MKRGIFNVTIGKWVKDADSDTGALAVPEDIVRVRVLAQLNPRHANDVFEVREISRSHDGARAEIRR